MTRDELAAWLRLHTTPGVGSSSARKLLAAFGLPEDILGQSQTALCQVVSSTQARALQQAPANAAELLETTWRWLQEAPEHRRILPLGDPHYPQALLNTEDPPVLLHAMGAPEAFGTWGINSASNVCLAVVGSRNPTPQGLANARQFSKNLAQAGLTIVSGLALGVDGAAHEGALDGPALNPLATIAIVGTGLDRVYPKQHRELAHRIAQHGVILSEYVLGTPPLATHFPQRNRIIAGLARGTLVVEAALQSGSLITARLAAEQGSEVFAIPGSIHAAQSRGCHALIKQGAKLVESAQDVLDELQRATPAAWSALSPPAHPASDETAAPHTTPTPTSEDDARDALFANDVLTALGFDPVGLDALQARTGLDTPTLQAKLMALELQNQVARLPGGLFQRMGRA